MKIEKCIYVDSLEGDISFKEIVLCDVENTSYNELCESFVPKKEYVPVKDDKIFFIPGCNVPRFKVKKFCLDNQVALVKYIEKANVKFVGPESFKLMIIPQNDHFWEKHHFLTHIKKQSNNNPVYFPLINALWNCPSKYVVTRRLMRAYVESAGIRFYELDDLIRDGSTPEYMFTSPESYDKFLSITSDPQVYPQEEIVKRINTGGIMGQKEYESIQRMLKSTDKENLRLAMEAMANSDYEKSCVPLLLILKEYGKAMDSSSSRFHVNFKSLLKFFGIEVLTNINLNIIIETLLKKKLLNKTNLDLLMPLAIDSMTGDFDEGGIKYFKVDKVGVTDVIKQGLSENILDRSYNTQVIEEDEELNPKL